VGSEGGRVSLRRWAGQLLGRYQLPEADYCLFIYYCISFIVYKTTKFIPRPGRMMTIGMKLGRAAAQSGNSGADPYSRRQPQESGREWIVIRHLAGSRRMKPVTGIWCRTTTRPGLDRLNLWVTASI
jgi:hypothetical protein